jgi:hypothetical protein
VLGRRLSLAALALSIALGSVLWSVPYVATHDGPNHLAKCVLANRLSDPARGLDRYLVRGSPITEAGYHYMCRPLEALLGWRWAHRAAITLVALVFALGYLAFSTSVARDSPFHLLGFGYALPWCFWMGFFDYELAMGLALAIGGYVIRRLASRGLDRRVWLAIAFGTWLVAFVHAFVAGILGGLLALLVLGGVDKGRRARALLMLLLAGLPALAIALASRGGTDVVGLTVWGGAAEKATTLASTFLGGPALRAWPPVLLAIAGVVLGIRGWRRSASAKTSGLVGVYALLLFLAYALTPNQLASWAYFSPRFAFLALSIAPLAIPEQTFAKPAALRAGFACVVLFDLGATLWALHFERTMEPLVEEALSGLDAPIARDGPRLPLILLREPEIMKDVQPLVNIGHLYLFDQGGIDPYLWADQPLIDAILYKDKPTKLFGPHPGPFMRESLKCAGQTPDCPPVEAQYEWHTVWARGFQDAILFSDDTRALETFVRRGYAIDFQKGRLAILHATSCRFIVRIAGDAGLSKLPSAVIVHAGITGLEAPTTESTLPAGAPISRDGLGLVIEGKSCGPMWITLVSAGASVCKEADARGRIYVDAQHESTAETRCTLRDAAPK